MKTAFALIPLIIASLAACDDDESPTAKWRQKATQFEPCGGDLQGNWNFEEGIDQLDYGNCLSIKDLYSHNDGHALFTDTEFDLKIVRELTFEVMIDLSCTTTAPEQYSQTCQNFAHDMAEYYDSIECQDYSSSSSCKCRISSSAAELDLSGTYTVNNNVALMTISDSNQDQLKGKRMALQYCIEEDTLIMREQAYAYPGSSAYSAQSLSLIFTRNSSK